MQRLQQSTSLYGAYRAQLQEYLEQLKAGQLSSATAWAHANGYGAAVAVARSEQLPVGEEIQDVRVIQSLLNQLEQTRPPQREKPKWVIAFGCKKTEALFYGEKVSDFAEIRDSAFRKLQELSSAETLSDLKGNGKKLEQLRTDHDTYSIRINNKWRLCFNWKGPRPSGVKIVNYH